MEWHEVYYNLSQKKYAHHENHVSFTEEILNENVAIIFDFQFDFSFPWQFYSLEKCLYLSVGKAATKRYSRYSKIFKKD